MFNINDRELRFRLKDLRIEKGWNQSDLAEKLGVSMDSIKLWESGRHNPGIKNAKKVRDILEEAGI